MPNTVHEALRLVPLRSRYLLFYLLLLHGLVLFMVAIFPTLLAYRIALGLTVVIHLFYQLGQHYWRNTNGAIIAATLDGRGQWNLEIQGSKFMEAILLPSSYVHPHLLILNFRIGRLRYLSLILPPDTANPELLRKLRVRLKTSGP